jgi:hypothetical protein
MVTFGPKAGGDVAALAIEPPVLALNKSATRTTARDRVVVDRRRDMESSSFPAS